MLLCVVCNVSSAKKERNDNRTSHFDRRLKSPPRTVNVTRYVYDRFTVYDRNNVLSPALRVYSTAFLQSLCSAFKNGVTIPFFTRLASIYSAQWPTATTFSSTFFGIAFQRFACKLLYVWNKKKMTALISEKIDCQRKESRSMSAINVICQIISSQRIIYFSGEKLRARIFGTYSNFARKSC